MCLYHDLQNPFGKSCLYPLLNSLCQHLTTVERGFLSHVQKTCASHGYINADLENYQFSPDHQFLINQN